jgi:hypothetical protein
MRRHGFAVLAKGAIVGLALAIAFAYPPVIQGAPPLRNGMAAQPVQAIAPGLAKTVSASLPEAVTAQLAGMAGTLVWHDGPEGTLAYKLFLLLVALVVVACFFNGLSRMGFAAGLAWFVGVILLFGIAWPLALICAVAITVYGLGGLGARRA